MRDNTRPQWQDAKQRIEELGIDLADVVLAEWEPEGEHLMGGIIGTRDGRVFMFSMVYDYDPDGGTLPKGEGWISDWKEIPSSEIGTTPSGYPNIWAAMLIITRLVLGMQAGDGSDRGAPSESQ